MPLLEFITASLKSDATSQKVFRSQWPVWRKPLVDAAGASQVHYGYMISENDVNVESEMKLVMSLKWNQPAEFTQFLSSAGFKAFGGNVKPFALSPAEPQLYESTAEGVSVFERGITEVFRTKVTDENAAEVGKTWESFVNTIKEKHDVRSLHGLSLNLTEKSFVGAIGWRSLEDRDAANEDTTITHARKELLKLKPIDSFVVKMIPA